MSLSALDLIRLEVLDGGKLFFMKSNELDFAHNSFKSA